MTIGHTLLGLSLATATPVRSRARLFAAWAGIVVLAAHLVDIVEWVVVDIARADLERRFLTESPVASAGLATVLCAGLAGLTRTRNPWTYLALFSAVLSHLVLDANAVRHAVWFVYDPWISLGIPGRIAGLESEGWLLGLVFVIALATRAAREQRVPVTWIWILIGVSVAAAATRIPWLWIPAYAISGSGCAVFLGDRLKPRLAWNLVPLIPVLMLPAFEIAAAEWEQRGRALRRNGRFAEALVIHERLLWWPSRSSKVWTHVHIALCHQGLDQPAEAEAALVAAKNIARQPFIPNYYLARFYADSAWRGTRFFQPDKAVSLLQAIQNQADEAAWHEAATSTLERLHRQGAIPTPALDR